MQVLKGVVAIYPLYANKIYRTSVRRLLWLWWCVLDCTQSLSLLVRSNREGGASDRHRRAENGNPVSRVVAHLARSITRKGEKMLAKKRKLLTRNQPIECRSSCLRRTGTFKIGLLQFCAEKAFKILQAWPLHGVGTWEQKTPFVHAQGFIACRHVPSRGPGLRSTRRSGDRRSSRLAIYWLRTEVTSQAFTCWSADPWSVIRGTVHERWMPILPKSGLVHRLMPWSWHTCWMEERNGPNGGDI